MGTSKYNGHASCTIRASLAFFIFYMRDKSLEEIQWIFPLLIAVHVIGFVFACCILSVKADIIRNGTQLSKKARKISLKRLYFYTQIITANVMWVLAATNNSYDISFNMAILWSVVGVCLMLDLLLVKIENL